MAYFLFAIIAARVYIAVRRAPLAPFAPGVSILKSLKGLDPGMLDAFRSHCRQTYAGGYEMLFGVSSLDDPAVPAVQQLQSEFPERTIRLIECPSRLGTNGKVSTLAQLVPQARCEYILVNDSDITVSPRYLERVMAHFRARGAAAERAASQTGRTGDGALSRSCAWHARLATRVARHRHRFHAQRSRCPLDRGRSALRPRLDACRQPRGSREDWRLRGTRRSSRRRL